MESVIYQDSPLAELLEGEGRAEPDWVDASGRSSSESTSPISTAFAPRGPSTLHARIRNKLPQPLTIPSTNNSHVAKIHSACSRAVNSRLGRADNERFLEHFRYIIVASHLLSEHTANGGLKPRYDFDSSPARSDYNPATISLGGAVASAVAAFILVWVVHWARGTKPGAFANKGRLTVALVAFAVATAVAYVYIRRQWLRNLRYQAVDAVTALVTNLHALDGSTSTTLTFVQEVELISRGYRISSPLPPISRLEDKGQNRRCNRLRRSARNAFVAVLPNFIEQCQVVRSLVDPDDLEKYMDVYELSPPEIQEASARRSDSEFDDVDSIRVLRVFQYRLDILRRLFLCSLLALEADGGKPDFLRWRLAIQAMESLAAMSGEWSRKINAILSDEEQFTIASPKANVHAPGKERVRGQLRKLGALSQGIRGLQAKMQILREESNRTLEESDDVTELGASLMSQYDSIGADVKALVQAWETGKAALAANIDRQERRISQASLDVRSPATSLSGLTAVEEGDPSDALRALNGDLSSRSGRSSLGESSSDEEVFEAIALPRQRPRMTMEERKAKLQDDRIRQQNAREQREASTNMLKELESVITLRVKPNSSQHGRITSI